MREDLVEHFLENSKILDISAIWFVVKRIPLLMIIQETNHGYVDESYEDSMVKTISPIYFRKKRKLFLNAPLNFIDQYRNDKPLEFVDYDYESNSWYDAYKKFVDNNDVCYYCNFHASFAYFSVIDHMYHLVNIKFKINLESLQCINIHLGTWSLAKRDIMAELVFDDLEYLKKNFDKEFMQKIFMKYLHG